MPTAKLKEYLDSRGVRYVSIKHSPAFTAPEVAASAHIAGSDFAKTVIVKSKGGLAMVVLPADRKIILGDLRDMMGHEDVELATEAEFKDRFPDCELGAMPPFGNLYGLPVYVADNLSDEKDIGFNAGTHREAIKMDMQDYLALVNPRVVGLITT